MTDDHIQTLLRVVAALAKREPAKELRFTEADLRDPGLCAMVYDQATGELILRWFDPTTQAGDAAAMVKAAADAARDADLASGVGL